MKFLIPIIILILGSSSYSQENTPRQGEIIDQISILGTTGETFALYLPNSHNPKSPSAIIFIFDPAARGNTGIEPFIGVAEKYNYILVCSNNIRNAPYDHNLQLTERLFTHVFSNFNVNEQRIYTAGFSGGSRLASVIAVLTDAVQGVVGCGAGFSRYPLHYPTSKNNFDYAGLVGDSDMNYQEMLKANEWLSSQGLKNEFFIYEDDHRWPPPSQLMRAFEWLELQAIKKGLKPMNMELIKTSFENNISTASAFEGDNNMFEAALEYERTVRNYSAYFNLDSLSPKIKSLHKMKSYKNELKDREQVGQLEGDLSLKYLDKFHKEIELGKSTDNFKWWGKQLKLLDEKYIASERETLYKMGKRLRYQIYAVTIETLNELLEDNSLRKASYCAEFLVIQTPKNPYSHYRVAKVYAKLKSEEKAHYHLEKAMDFGWKNKSVIQDDEEFNTIFSKEQINRLLKNY